MGGAWFRAIEDVLHSIAKSRANSLEEDAPNVEMTPSGDARIVGAGDLPAWHSGTELSQPVHVPVPSRPSKGQQSISTVSAAFMQSWHKLDSYVILTPSFCYVASRSVLPLHAQVACLCIYLYRVNASIDR